MKIMVCLDGSPLAEKGLPAAMEMASRFSPREEVAVELVSVLDPGHMVPKTHYITQQTLLQSYLAHTAKNLANGSYRVNTHIWAGPVVDILLAYVQSESPDLVVATSHGRGGLGRFLLGSVTDRLTRGVRCPLLVVRGEPRSFKRILVPVDTSPESHQAWTMARQLARPEDLITLLRVLHFPEPWFMDRQIPDAWAHEVRVRECHEAEEYLLGLAEGTAAGTLIREGSPAEQILDVATHSDLIVMSSHISDVGRIFLGSVAERVLHHAPCTVLLTRGNERIGKR